MLQEKIKTRGRPRKPTIQDLWLDGINHRFENGDIVSWKRNPDSVGVIQYALASFEEYHIKWYMGPKPWNFVEGDADGLLLVKSNKPNPLKYTWSDFVPGPSTDAINKLEAKYAETAANKVRTSKDIDVYVESLEEEMNKRNKFEPLTEVKADSIVNETLEEDDTLPINDKDQKIETIVNEE